MFTNNADVASLAVGLVLPLIVALFTRPSTNSTVKAISHAVLSVATGIASVYQAHPQGILWAPAVIAAFFAWLSGTAIYHSLLKKYAWVGWLQNALVREGAALLHTKEPAYADYLEIASGAEQGDVNNFPLSTDVVQAAAEGVVQAAENLPVVGQVVQAFDGHATTQTLPGAPETPAV